MPVWHPGDVWPSSTPGGAVSPKWGGYVKLFVRAALAAGAPFHMGPHATDRLDSGNVLAAPVAELESSTVNRLWVDIACDVKDLELAGGSSSAAGIFSKPEAATLVATLADPTGKFDPLNGHGPYSYGRHSRLVPGTPISAFAEIVNGDTGAVTTVQLFTGTADSWGEDWTPHPSRREAKLVASDATKQWAHYDQPEQPAVGAGDTTAQRVARLVAFYQWPGTIDAGTGTVTLQATTLAQTGWELLNRTLDDELGHVYFTAAGVLRWVGRAAWTTTSPPVLELGCDSIEASLNDVLLDASPSAIDANIRNAVFAAREGGSQQTVRATSSIARYGEYDYSRTDLGLQTDVQAAAWAQQVLQVNAYPQVTLDDVTARPAIDARSWEIYTPLLGLHYVTDLVRIAWAPPDYPDHVIDGLMRVVGHQHTITRQAWDTKLTLVAAQPLRFAGVVFTMGPDAQDRLDAGNILALTH